MTFFDIPVLLRKYALVPAPALAVDATALFPLPSPPATPVTMPGSVDAFSLVSDDLAAMTHEIHAELEASQSLKTRSGPNIPAAAMGAL